MQATGHTSPVQQYEAWYTTPAVRGEDSLSEPGRRCDQLRDLVTFTSVSSQL
ncbi:hypothetical protein J6590_013528 [Homalodisca vitripennis]|nr:hypothetical protein J6590_013528 [Homalodisca vitripennis]